MGERVRINKIVDEMTLFDDDLLSRVFDKNKEATDLLLNIILQEKQISVVTVTGQRELKNKSIGGKSVRLDILAKDAEGRLFDVEVQRDNSGAVPQRARYNSRMIDGLILKAGEEYTDMKDSYVIFLTESDYLKHGDPLYHIDRTVKETGRNFGDGSHIVYVNGEYRGDDPIGKLISDFHNKDAATMYYKPLADGVRYYKETEKGREDVCEAVEAYARECAEEVAKKAEEKAAKVAREVEANRLMELADRVRSVAAKLSYTTEQAMDLLDVSESDRAILFQNKEQ